MLAASDEGRLLACEVCHEPATSSGLPNRPPELRMILVSSTSWNGCDHLGANVAREMVLTVTPCGQLPAPALGKAMHAGLGRRIIGLSECAFLAVDEEMLTIRPQPRSTMPSQTCRVMLKHESRLVCMTASS